MVVILSLTRLPRIQRKDDEKSGTWATYKDLFKRRTVILYFFGIMAYVGTEQGVANWISQFLSIYHKYDPQITGRAGGILVLGADDDRLCPGACPSQIL